MTEEQQIGSGITTGGVVSIIVLAIDLILLGGLALVMDVTRPGMVHLFEEFGAELPMITVWLVAVPRGVSSVGAVVVGGVLVVKEAAVKRTSLNLAVNVLVGLVLVVLVALVVAGLVVPVQRLIHELS